MTSLELRLGATLIMVFIVSATSTLAQDCCTTTLDPIFGVDDEEEGVEFDADDQVGKSVGIDGNFAVIGAQQQCTSEPPPMTGPGAAMVFEYDGGWVHVQNLRAPLALDGDAFGGSAGISGDSLIIGAKFTDVDGVSNAGRAYVFDRNTTTGEWSVPVAGTLESADTVKEMGDQFGHAVAIHANTVVVGAHNDNSKKGKAFIYERDHPDPGEWGHMVSLQPTDISGDAEFGWSVAIDNDTVVVGARFDDVGSPSKKDAGSAYIFGRDVNGDGEDEWGEVAKLTAGTPVAGDQFGKDVAVDMDAAHGPVIVVGAPLADNFDGKAYVFRRTAQVPHVWVLECELFPCDVPSTGRHAFGWSVSVDDDIIVIGARGGFAQPGVGGDSVYTFRRLDEGWVLQQELDADQPGTTDIFGWDSWISGGRVVIGAACFDNGAEEDEGAFFTIDNVDTDLACNCPNDLNVDGIVGFDDLLDLLSNWGPCPQAPEPCRWDFNGDDVVDQDDLDELIEAWGDCPNVIGPTIDPVETFVENNSCLDESDWEDFIDKLNDPGVSQAEKDRWACWVNHYLNECNPSCGYSTCTGVDPFGDPCNRH